MSDWVTVASAAVAIAGVSAYVTYGRRLTRATDRDKLATMPLGQIRAIEDATAVRGEW